MFNKFKRFKYILLALCLVSSTVLTLVTNVAHAATTVTITSPTNGSTATGTSFTVTGTATADRLITVTVNGDEAGTTTSDGSGDWSLEVTGQDPGAKTIEATASVGYAYVANRGAATISVINTVTDEKVGSDISSVVNQQNAVISPDGTQMVTVSGFGVGNAIKVWSLADPEVPVITHSLTTALTHAVAVFYSPDGNYFFVSSEAGNFSSGMVRRYNSSDPTTSADVTGYNQNFPAYLSFSSDSSRLYVCNVISGTMSVINVATNTQLSTFASSGGGGPLMSDDINGYSVRNNNDSVYPYNVQSETTGSPIAVGDGPVGSTFNQDQSRLLVANLLSDNISVINTGTNTVVDTVSTGTGSNPYTMAFTNDYSKVYLTEFGLDQISILDPTTLAETGTIAVGDAPSAVAMGPAQTATTSVSITLGSSSTSNTAADSLADTGQNTRNIELLAIVLLTSGLAIATYSFNRRRKGTYASTKN